MLLRKNLLIRERVLLRERLSHAGTESRRVLPYWVAAIITGLVCYIFGLAFARSEELGVTWLVHHAGWAFVTIPLALLTSSALVRWGAPAASGSGIPQLIAAVELANGPSRVVPRLLSLRMVVVKFLSACVCVGGGGVVGREGPSLQISAAVFYQVFRRWPKLRTTLNLPSMILAGGAAGLASAFNTPLGGVVFAVEELAKVHVSNIRTTVFHSVIIAGLMAQAALGDYLYLGKVAVVTGGTVELLRVAALALGVGAIGALFGECIVRALKFRAQLSHGQSILLTACGGLIVATIFWFVGAPGIGAGKSLMVQILNGRSSQSVSLGLGFARVATNFFTYISGVAGGIFAPSLASGACFGRWYAEWFPSADPRLFALAGMVAFLTGVTRNPFTASVLVLEMTDSHSAIMALMTAAICAQGGAKLVSAHSFYDFVSENILGAAREEEAALPVT